MNSRYGRTASFRNLYAASSGVVSLAGDPSRQTVNLTACQMPHTDVKETSSRRGFSHRPQPSSPDNGELSKYLYLRISCTTVKTII